MSIAAPRLAATIERRLLVNYRVAPDAAASLLPAGLRPQLVDGSAVAGICLIRLGALRPAALPVRMGWRGEAAAHRIAVEWDDAGDVRTGVFIPVRHAASRLPVLAGGRVFPGVHRHARFHIDESAARYRVDLEARDESVRVEVAEAAGAWSSSLFPTLGAASDFFRAGSVGWSPNRSGTALEGLALTTREWRIRGAMVGAVSSSFFDRLPRGAAVLDGALLMTGVPIVWDRPGIDAPRIPERIGTTRSPTGGAG